MHRFASLALKSRIDARKRLFPRKTLQRLPSLPPEIRNHCSSGVVAFCRRNRSSLRQQRLESATEDRCRYSRCRRNHSSLRRRRLESAAEYRCRHGCCRRNYSSLRRRRLESATEDRCRYSRCRQNHSSLRQRKTESDTDPVAATAAAGGTVLLCGDEN